MAYFKDEKNKTFEFTDTEFAETSLTEISETEYNKLNSESFYKDGDKVRHFPPNTPDKFIKDSFVEITKDEFNEFAAEINKKAALSKNDQLARAYANPLTGSDKLLLESIRKEAEGKPDEAAEAKAAALSRIKEIKAMFNT